MSWSDSDVEFIRAAIAEAEKANESGEVPVGAIVVQSGEIVGRGFNRTIQDCDPSAHAEVVAIRAAAEQQKNHRLNGATIYVTLEPCAMCVGAMIQARMQRLVFGTYDVRSGAAGTVIDLSNNKDFNHSIEVNGGLLDEECSAILKEFFTEKR